MVFEPFRSASGTAQIVHVFLLLFLFIAWVSTMVTFGGILHSAGGLDFYWDHASTPFGSASYSGSCKSGGDATLAFAVFAFLAFLIHLPLAWARVAGFSLVRDTQTSIKYEFYLSLIEDFCFFLQTCIWGGTCWNQTSSPTGKGYGLIIASFFFLLINTFFYFMMMRTESWVIGVGASRSGGGGGGSGTYEPDTHHTETASDAGQPTFSYQAPLSDAPATSL